MSGYSWVSFDIGGTRILDINKGDRWMRTIFKLKHPGSCLRETDVSVQSTRGQRTSFYLWNDREVCHVGMEVLWRHRCRRLE
jgi:hypothetical protein